MEEDKRPGENNVDFVTGCELALSLLGFRFFTAVKSRRLEDRRPSGKNSRHPGSPATTYSIYDYVWSLVILMVIVCSASHLYIGVL
jgi:hypothetical protein